MKVKFLILSAILLTALVAFAVESNKPSTHDTSWIKRHGQASKVNGEECKMCHVDQVSCIKCHQETPPRNHTPSWTKKGHGLEAKWDRESCATCHKEDSCIECHSSTPPSTHRPGWREPVNRHCDSCHYPVQQTTCFTCHKSAHAPNTYLK
ncbi:hypothetical protein [Limisalsivibrio acetivorans]|uniref:hypothetical protein n=1 Tax=Limisalsivibrio acetivorans TaxID=1304888 RepID=UPI0009DBBB4A|nr:hypothetical protein [Limisalsivibrio acetivorans]